MGNTIIKIAETLIRPVKQENPPLTAGASHIKHEIHEIITVIITSKTEIPNTKVSKYQKCQNADFLQKSTVSQGIFLWET